MIQAHLDKSTLPIYYCLTGPTVMPLKRICFLPVIALMSFSYTAYADTLLDVYQAAKIKDPTILTSKAEYDLYAEKISEATGALLPQLSLSADVAGYNSSGNENTDTTYSNYGATLALSQSLYNSSYWQSLNIAEKQAQQYAVDYEYAAQDLILRTATAYFDVLRADEAVKSVKANKRAVARQLDQIKQSFDVGLIDITDVHEAQAEFDSTIADEIIAENDLLNSYYTLQELTGEDITNVAYLNLKTFSPQKLEGDIKLWRNKSLEHNLLLHSERIAKDIAKMNIELAQAGHKPTLSLTGSLDYDDTQYDNDSANSDSHSSSAIIGLTLNVPLYAGGQVTSQVKQAQYDYVIANQKFTEIYRTISTEISSSYSNVRASISSIKAYTQTVVSSKSALDAVEAGYEVGTRTTVDVLEATQSLYDSEKNLADARYDYIINILTLKSSAGMLTEQDLVDISAGLIKK